MPMNPAIIEWIKGIYPVYTVLRMFVTQPPTRINQILDLGCRFMGQLPLIYCYLAHHRNYQEMKGASQLPPKEDAIWLSIFQE